MIKTILKHVIGISTIVLFFLSLFYLVYLMWYFAFIFLDRTTILWCICFVVREISIIDVPYFCGVFDCFIRYLLSLMMVLYMWYRW